MEDLIQGRDGHVRAANVRMGNHRTSRPIVKLYPLEVSNSNNEDQTGPSESTRQEMDDLTHSNRTREKAATNALCQMAEWADTLNCAWEDVEND